MDFLGLTNWEVISIDVKQKYCFIRAKYNFQTKQCRYCRSQILQKYGTRTKVIKDLPMRAKPTRIQLIVQRFKCLLCSRTFTQKVNQIEKKTRITKRLVKVIEDKRFDETNIAMHRHTGVNENKIREITVNHMRKRQKQIIMPTPEVLGIDGVHLGGKERCILTDIKNKRFIELSESVDAHNVGKCFLDLQNKHNVKVVVMDMSRAFRAAAKKIFGDRIPIVIDKYHIQRIVNKTVREFLQKIRKKYLKVKTFISKEDQKRFFPNRFVLQKRSYNLCDEDWSKLEEWGHDFPDLADIYNLKEEFLQIWNHTSRIKAEGAFDVWRSKIPPRLRSIFRETLTAFANWREEIFNYFDYMFTNAFTESMNSLIKMIRRQCRAVSWETIRVKMLHRAFNELTKEEEIVPVTNDYTYVTPKKQQRVLQLQQARLNRSKVFGLMFPKESSYLIRFAPYSHLFYRSGMNKQ